MADQYEIFGTEKSFSDKPGRQGKIDRVILYRAPDGISRFTSIPDETFTMPAAEAAVRAFEAERRLATPHRFTI